MYGLEAGATACPAGTSNVMTYWIGGDGGSELPGPRDAPIPGGPAA